MWLVPSLLVMVGCVIYVVRRPSPAGFLALAGNAGTVFMHLARTLFHSFAGYSFRGWGAMALQALAFLCAVLFGIGFVLMALETRRLSPVPGSPGE
jgi:hypothetical protein